MAKKKAVEAAEPETSDEKKLEKVVELKKPKNPVLGILAGERVITESSDDARDFFNQSRFGTLNEGGKVELSLLEALYLLERERLIIKSESGKVLSFELYVKKAESGNGVHFVEPAYQLGGLK